jgi:aspartyl-tRNA(Asn)/glutamyl-tRNA(Gln) amidotransferase subunit C
MAQQFSPEDVFKVALLANIPIDEKQARLLADGFTKTMKVVEELNSVPTDGIEPTHHTAGLENVMREDVVDESRMFTQKQALANAPRQHDGFFVVDLVIDYEA